MVGWREMERADNEVPVLCRGEWIQIAVPARPGILAVSCHGDETTSPLLLTVTPRATEGPAGLMSIWQELCFPDRPWQPALSLSLLFSSSHPCFLSLIRSTWRDDTAFFFFIFRTMCPHLYFNGESCISHLYSRHFSPYTHTHIYIHMESELSRVGRLSHETAKPDFS